jgi:YVTN family beta-propeller protein
MKQFLLFSGLLLTMLSSCKKKDPVTTPVKVTTGVYALSEGTFSNNNTTLTYYDLKTGAATTDIFKNANGFGLGDTGNDIIIYGGKMYIMMDKSSYVEVADMTTAKQIKQIPFFNGATAREPRYAVGYKNKVYVSSYDGTVAVIDTTTLSIDKFVTVGNNPEQLTVCGNNLYVSNSGGLNYPNFDNTVSVVNLSTLTEDKKIVVGPNPFKITSDGSKFVYVVVRGDYGAFPSKLVKIDATSNTVKQSTAMDVAGVKYYNSFLYAYGSHNVFIADTTNLSMVRANFIADGTMISSPYGLNIDNATGDVYVTDAKDYSLPGEVFAFDLSGKKKYSFSVAPGISPNSVAIVKQ